MNANGTSKMQVLYILNEEWKISRLTNSWYVINSISVSPKRRILLLKVGSSIISENYDDVVKSNNPYTAHLWQTITDEITLISSWGNIYLTRLSGIELKYQSIKTWGRWLSISHSCFNIDSSHFYCLLRICKSD